MWAFFNYVCCFLKPQLRSINYSSMYSYMVVSWNRATPKSSILMGFSSIHQPFLIPQFIETQHPKNIVTLEWSVPQKVAISSPGSEDDGLREARGCLCRCEEWTTHVTWFSQQGSQTGLICELSWVIWGVSQNGGTPHPFIDGFSIINFGVPPLMETSIWILYDLLRVQVQSVRLEDGHNTYLIIFNIANMFKSASLG